MKCDKLRNARAGKINPDDLVKATAALQAGSTVKQVLKGVEIRGGRRVRTINTPAFYRYRLTHPDYDRIVRDAIERRIAPCVNPVLAVEAGTYQYEWNPADLVSISSMLPPGFPDKDAVINEVIIALLEGRLHRAQIKDKIRWYIKEQYGMVPNKFSKFGSAKLVSLDEAMFEDGPRTRGDTVSRSLWD